MTSDRTRVILAKAVIAAALAIALGVLSVPVARLVAAAWYGFGGAGSWDASLGTAIHYGYGTVIAYAGFAVLGVVIGVLTRSVGIGIGVAFAGLFVLDSILGSVSFYSEYAFTSIVATLLNPDVHQSRFPLFGSVIALLTFYAGMLIVFTIGIERWRDV